MIIQLTQRKLNPFVLNLKNLFTPTQLGNFYFYYNKPLKLLQMSVVHINNNLKQTLENERIRRGERERKRKLKKNK